MITWIKGANYIVPEGLRHGTDLLVDGHTVVALGDCLPGDTKADRIVDARELYLSPGLIDLHVHGGGGADFADGTVEAFVTAAHTHLAHGTTALMPTLVACAQEEMEAVFCAYDAMEQVTCPMPERLGIHIEGPYLAPNMAGALDPQYLHAPCKEEYTHWLKYYRHLARMTVAPELIGATALIDAFVAAGRMVSLGHSDAQFADIEQAVAHGCRLVTHLYSAMSTICRVDGHRKLGLIEAALLLDGLWVEVIADGVHLPKELLQLIVKTKKQEDIVLVTDAMRAAGQGVDASILGSLAKGQAVLVEDGVAKMPDRTAFAGSIATADRLIRTMVQVAGVPLPLAIGMMTSNPAKVLKRPDLGVLQVGGRADLVLWTKDLSIHSVYAMGELV